LQILKKRQENGKKSILLPKYVTLLIIGELFFYGIQQGWQLQDLMSAVNQKE